MRSSASAGWRRRSRAACPSSVLKRRLRGRTRQGEKLTRLRAERDEAATQRALAALTEGARGKANLLQLSVEAARAKATVGEISLAMEDAFGRHVAVAKAISGVYLAASGRAADANRRVIAMTR